MTYGKQKSPIGNLKPSNNSSKSKTGRVQPRNKQLIPTLVIYSLVFLSAAGFLTVSPNSPLYFFPSKTAIAQPVKNIGKINLQKETKDNQSRSQTIKNFFLEVKNNKTVKLALTLEASGEDPKKQCGILTRTLGSEIASNAKDVTCNMDGKELTFSATVATEKLNTQLFTFQWSTSTVTVKFHGGLGSPKSTLEIEMPDTIIQPKPDQDQRVSDKVFKGNLADKASVASEYVDVNTYWNYGVYGLFGIGFLCVLLTLGCNAYRRRKQRTNQEIEDNFQKNINDLLDPFEKIPSTSGNYILGRQLPTKNKHQNIFGTPIVPPPNVLTPPSKAKTSTVYMAQGKVNLGSQNTPNLRLLGKTKVTAPGRPTMTYQGKEKPIPRGHSLVPPGVIAPLPSSNSPVKRIFSPNSPTVAGSNLPSIGTPSGIVSSDVTALNNPAIGKAFPKQPDQRFHPQPSNEQSGKRNQQP